MYEEEETAGKAFHEIANDIEATVARHINVKPHDDNELASTITFDDGDSTVKVLYNELDVPKIVHEMLFPCLYDKRFMDTDFEYFLDKRARNDAIWEKKPLSVTRHTSVSTKHDGNIVLKFDVGKLTLPIVLNPEQFENLAKQINLISMSENLETE